jgi:hypothetical protein
MGLRSVIEKNEKVSSYKEKIKKARDEYERLIQEFTEEKSNCSHELVVNFGEEPQDKPCKSGPSNAHYCLACLTYNAKPIYMNGPVDWLPEDIDRIENDFPFAHSEMLNIRKNNGELISRTEQHELLLKFKKILVFEILVVPDLGLSDLTVQEFCDIFNSRMPEHTLKIGENQRVKVRR